MHFSFLSIAAFVGSFITMSLVYRISTSSGKTNVVMMLLSGVAITALGFAVMGLLIYISKEEQLRDLRSEEHTSELQSRPHLVCRLLLEKKKPRDPTLL